MDCAKSDVGTYSYGARPHAVGAVWGTVSGSFTYDADGNTLAGPASATATRSTSWNSFDMPTEVAEGGASLTFYYGPEHQRVQQVAVSASVTTTITYFSDGHAAAERIVSGSTTNWRDYVDGPDGAVAVAYGGTWYYLHGDHQDSVTTTASSAGAATPYGFDAWGKRRYANGNDDTGDQLTSPNQTTRGYIGQEELDGVSLVHLNARLYDPFLARFMSRDPMGLAAGPNRYGYASNNPATRSDPTGLDDGGSTADLPEVQVKGQWPYVPGQSGNISSLNSNDNTGGGGTGTGASQASQNPGTGAMDGQGAQPGQGNKPAKGKASTGGTRSRTNT